MGRRKWKSVKKKRSGAATVLLGIFLLALLAAGGVTWLVLTPYGPESETFVELAPGSSTPLIGGGLEAAGMRRRQFAFDLLRFWERDKLRAGEYRFDPEAAVTEVYARTARG